MSRISTPKIGDIYKAFLPNGNVKYFQFISPNNPDNLGGEAIRIFDIEHPREVEVPLEVIVKSKSDFFAITYIKPGLRAKDWEKVGNFPLPANFVQPMFKVTADLKSETPKSYQWRVWQVPEKEEEIGELPDKYRFLPNGAVFGPLALVRLMERGRHYDYEPL